jgi:2-methylisocitrate lyase-like PEP mutase family enzyme
MRRLIERDKIFVRPGCHDALSARITEAAGFEAIGMSGYAVSVSRLGKPDVGLITLTESVQMCRYICSAVDIPVMADADTGYGNAINAMRAVEEIIKAGAGGLFIEDQVDPKRCGHVAGKQLVSIEEASGKIRAADRVRKDHDPDFVLMARTDGRGAQGGGFQEAIDRAKAYVDAGADIIFPEGLVSVDEIGRMVEALSVPISYNRTGVSPMLSLPKLEQLGVRMVANAIGAFRASSRGLWDYLREGDGPEPVAGLERFLGT